MIGNNGILQNPIEGNHAKMSFQSVTQHLTDSDDNNDNDNDKDENQENEDKNDLGENKMVVLLKHTTTIPCIYLFLIFFISVMIFTTI